MDVYSLILQIKKANYVINSIQATLLLISGMN